MAKVQAGDDFKRSPDWSHLAIAIAVCLQDGVPNCRFSLRFDG